MPLLDHFHPPVSERRSWEGFHSLWAAALVEKLNRDVLAAEYFADLQVHVGSHVEVDITTLHEPGVRGDRRGAGVVPAGHGPGPPDRWPWAGPYPSYRWPSATPEWCRWRWRKPIPKRAGGAG